MLFLSLALSLAPASPVPAQAPPVAAAPVPPVAPPVVDSRPRVVRPGEVARLPVRVYSLPPAPAFSFPPRAVRPFVPGEGLTPPITVRTAAGPSTRSPGAAPFPGRTFTPARAVRVGTTSAGCPSGG